MFPERVIIARQTFPLRCSELWHYCRDPSNLQHFCPASMRFKILTPDLPPSLVVGQHIKYSLQPLQRLPLRVRWTTEVPLVVESPSDVEKFVKSLSDNKIDSRTRTMVSQFVQQSAEDGGAFFAFVDQQVSGPYLRWYHEHLFVDLPTEKSSAMIDRVFFRLIDVPQWNPVYSHVVRPELEKIFAFRQKHLRDKFGEGECELSIEK